MLLESMLRATRRQWPVHGNELQISIRKQFASLYLPSTATTKYILEVFMVTNSWKLREKIRLRILTELLQFAKFLSVSDSLMLTLESASKSFPFWAVLEILQSSQLLHSGKKYSCIQVSHKIVVKILLLKVSLFQKLFSAWSLSLIFNEI